ncbi:MAG: hypothetical protein ACFCD0_00085 [Gemmataceae bacterium]
MRSDWFMDRHPVLASTGLGLLVGMVFGTFMGVVTQVEPVVGIGLGALLGFGLYVVAFPFPKEPGDALLRGITAFQWIRMSTIAIVPGGLLGAMPLLFVKYLFWQKCLLTAIVWTGVSALGGLIIGAVKKSYDPDSFVTPGPVFEHEALWMSVSGAFCFIAALITFFAYVVVHGNAQRGSVSVAAVNTVFWSSVVLLVMGVSLLVGRYFWITPDVLSQPGTAVLFGAPIIVGLTALVFVLTVRSF